MKNASTFTQAAIGLLFVTVAAAVSAADVNVITQRMPPLIDKVDGKLGGPVTIFVEKLLKDVGVTNSRESFEIMPLARLLQTLGDGHTIAYPVVLTPDREHKYKFIVELYGDSMYFVTLSSKKPVNTIADAKRLSSIGATSASAPEIFLKKNGFTNIQAVNDPTQNIIKLAAGRIDAWFATGTALQRHFEESSDKTPLTIGEPVAKIPLYLTGSMDLPDAVVEKIRKRFEELKTSPEYKAMYEASTRKVR